LSDFKHFWSSEQIFVEVLNIKPHGSRSSGIRAGTCWQRERGDEANGHFSRL